jgi:hypothetical protein
LSFAFCLFTFYFLLFNLTHFFLILLKLKLLMEEESSPLFDLDLQIDDAAGSYLRDTTKWTRIVSIIFIVITAIMFLCLLAMIIARSTMVDAYSQNNTSFSAYANTGEGIFLMVVIFMVLLIAILSAFVYLLLRFSRLTKKGIEANDQAMLESGIASLKNYLIITGIFTIISVLSGIYQFIKIF